MSIMKVAQRAGVSVATVSRVINNVGGVRSETAEQVRAAIREIGYTPPLYRRGPKGRRRAIDLSATTNQTILLLKTWAHEGPASDPMMDRAIAGAQRACEALGFSQTVHELAAFAPDAMPEMAGAAGAIVFFPQGSDRCSSESTRMPLPTVYVTSGENVFAGADHVMPHHGAIGRLALERLQRAGCQKVAVIAERPEWHFIRSCAAGFALAAADASLRADMLLIDPALAAQGAIVGSPGVYETADLAIREFLAAAPQAAGLFSPSESLAKSIHAILECLGVAIGEDVVLITCSDEPTQPLLPSLARIDVGSDEIGRSAVRVLVNRLERPNQPFATTLIQPRLHCLGAAARRQ